MPHRRILSSLLLRAVGALLLTMMGFASPATGQVLQLRQALSVAGEGPSFPAAPTARNVALPDDWTSTHPGYTGTVWYRVAFDAPQARDHGQMMALYIERACNTVQVQLNGRLVHAPSRSTQNVPRQCYKPQLVPIPAALLEPHGNVVDLRVTGYALESLNSREHVGGLSPVQFGPYATLAAQYDTRITMAITVPQVMAGAMALMGAFLIVMGWFNRGHSHLDYYGAMLIGWALFSSRIWLENQPWSNAANEFVYAAVMGVITHAGVQFLMRYGGRRARWLDILLPVQSAALPLTLMAAGPQHLFVTASAWYALLMIEALLSVVVYLRDKRRQGLYKQFWFMLGMLGATAVLLLATLAVQQLAPDPHVAEIIQLAMPVLFIAMGLRLVQQFGYALTAAQDDRIDMESRVREITSQMERNFTLLADQRVEQVTERERKRIAADLHDDLGAKLLTIVHTSEDPRISTLAREALEEMRLSVRGLTGKPVKLLDALGDWRAEVVNRLQQAGMEGEWQAPTDDLPQTLTARAYVQTTRILRESVSNIIKHSGATRCTVRCAIREGDFQLVVQDNGRGIPLEMDGRLDRGHGMSTMKQRAKQMQGQCLVESAPGYGTVIRLTLPLELHATTP